MYEEIFYFHCLFLSPYLLLYEDMTIGPQLKSQETSQMCVLVTLSCSTPLPKEFSIQEFWSGLPFPSPGDLPNPGIEPGSPALQADSLPTEPPGKHKEIFYFHYLFLSFYLLSYEDVIIRSQPKSQEKSREADQILFDITELLRQL